MPAERRGDDDRGAADASAGEFVTPPEPSPEQGGETKIAQQPDQTRVSEQPDATRIAQQPDQTRVSEQPGATRIAQQPDQTRTSDQPGETRVAEPDRTRVADQPAFASAGGGDEPVVEGTAVELPDEPAAAPRDAVAPTVERVQPAGVAEEPVAVATPGPAPDPVTTLGDSGEAYASGHAETSGASSWQEPVLKLANERPELVVAAAFAGGLLAAMILRRLGN